MTAYRCAVIGLGSMGYGMAQSCLRAGLVTHGVDVDAARVAQFLSDGGAPGALAEVAPHLDAVAVVVLNAAQLDSVLSGADGLVPRLRPGAVVLGCATVPPDTARTAAARCAKAGVLYLDAPISGGAAKAAQGRLSIMAAGPKAAFDAAQPLLHAVSDTVFDLGTEPGAGSAMKAVNQMLAGIHIAAMAEAITFGISQGIAPETFLKVIPQCAGSSWMLENRAPHVADGDYTPRSAIAIWPKDLGIVRDIAATTGFDTPLTAAALARYQKAVEMGLAAQDDAALAKVYAAENGLTLPGDAT